ncbi:3609_t:CDS:2 [Acaulospora colombiana]|uniref:3609_t:CDS:1 n=1 Tax=Acaulospora colombiana TaxID=27376 RepID=A0ACA9JZR4_9GLOM|nr:3609_t:CDS:2 [Acaulospora colombiana]
MEHLNIEGIISQIEKFFKEIDCLIGLQSRNENVNSSEIQRKFTDGKVLIDETEGNDEERFKFYRHKYHATYSRFLKIIGETDKAKRQEELAKKYEYFVKIDTCETILFPEILPDDDNQYSNPEEMKAQEYVEELMRKIQGILENEKYLKPIRQVFNQLGGIPKDLESYRNIIGCEAVLNGIVNGISNEGQVFLDESYTLIPGEVKDDAESRVDTEQLVELLNLLMLLARKMAYSRRISFMRSVLDSSKKTDILFSNVLFTEENINKRTRELSLYFHPDRTKNRNSENWLQEEHRHLGDEIFKLTIEFRDELLESLMKNEDLNYHEKKADKHWKKAIDLRNAANEQWNKLKILKKEDIDIHSSKKLKSLSVPNGDLAYYEYRAACKIADKTKQIKKQSLNTDPFTQQELDNAKNIFYKVKSNNPTYVPPKPNNNSFNTQTSEKTMVQKHPFLDKETNRVSIKKEIAKIMILNGNRSLVNYKTSEEEILRVKRRAQSYRRIGGAAILQSSVSGTSAAMIIAEASAIASASSIVLAGALGVCLPICLIYCGVKLWQKGTATLKEPRIREELNELIARALKAYDEENYNQFLEELSRKNNEMSDGLLKLEEIDNPNTPKNVIDMLIDHGFRPDGVAYLLCLIGEVLGTGKVKVEGKTTNELRFFAKYIFKGALDGKLDSEAEKLDNRIKSYKSKYSAKNLYRLIGDIFLFKELKDYAYTDEEYISDFQRMPFKVRLDEMQIIAKINLAIIDLLENDKEEIERAKKDIKEIRNSIRNDFRFVNTVKSRSEVLEDFFWVMSGEECFESNEFEPAESKPHFIQFNS